LKTDTPFLDIPV